LKILRMFTGTDNQSHIEEITLESRPELASPQAAESIAFRTWDAGHFIDWHHAPRKQFVLTLGGEMEIGLGDGSVHHFGPGDVLLAEDLTGQGHTLRVTGAKPRVSVAIPLAG